METHRIWEGYAHIVCIVLIVFLITGLFGSDVFATTHGSLLNQPNTTITAPSILLQSGSVGNCTIYTNNTSAKVSLANWFSINSTAFIAYKSNTGTNLLNSPKERVWNGTGWSTVETEIETGGSEIQWVRTAFCPVSSRYYEKILVALSSDDYLDAYVWNGSAWKVTNNIGQINTAASAYQSFDMAYETSTGRALLVYSLLSSDGTRDLAYRVWNGTAWSNEAYIDDTGHANHANYRWVELEPSPANNSDELALIAMDQTNADCNGWIWKNTAWGSFQELENNLASGVRDCRLMAVAYEQASCQAMFAWGYNGFMQSRIFNGTAWQNELPDVNITNTTNVLWISLKPDPVSNHLMATTIDGGSDLNSVFWNGTIWSSPVEHDISISHTAYRCADFDWEPSESKGLLVWSTAQDTVTYKSFTAPSTWSNASTTSNPSMHQWIQLRRNPRNVNGDVKILGSTLNGNLDIFGFQWNGSLLKFESTAFTTDANRIAYECFDVAFKLFGDPVDYDYVLRANNTVTDTWQVRLKAYSDSSINRLQNCTIYFHNSTGGNISQLRIENGAYTTQTGPWCGLGSSATTYIAMVVQTNSTGTSYINAYLEICILATTTYARYIITFVVV